MLKWVFGQKLFWIFFQIISEFLLILTQNNALLSFDHAGKSFKMIFFRVADIFHRKFTQLSDAWISFWIELFPNFFPIFLRNCRLISTDEKALFSFNCDGESLKLTFFLMWLTFSIGNLLSFLMLQSVFQLNLTGIFFQRLFIIFFDFLMFFWRNGWFYVVKFTLFEKNHRVFEIEDSKLQFVL